MLWLKNDFSRSRVIYIFLTIPHDNTQCWLFHKFMLSNFKLGLAVFDPGPCNLERLP